MSEAPVRLLVGLGNPGAKYAETRHNAGLWLVEAVAAQFGLSLRHDAKFHGGIVRLQSGAMDCWLLRPDTFMNHSGRSVAALANFYRIPREQILVAHDELDLPPGRVRLKRGGGHGGHNGLRDIGPALGGNDYARLRLGIGHPGHKDAVVGYVLSRPSGEERHAIQAGIDEITRVIHDLLEGRWQQATQELHSRT